jgi:hypothetical protein
VRAGGKTDTLHPGVSDIGERVARIERDQNFGFGGEMYDSGKSQHHKPRRHDRPEQPTDPAAAPTLDREYSNQHPGGDRHDIGLEGRGRDPIALKTEIAGVIIASPKNSEAPPRPIVNSTLRSRPAAGSASEINAIVPPSP